MKKALLLFALVIVLFAPKLASAQCPNCPAVLNAPPFAFQSSQSIQSPAFLPANLALSSFAVNPFAVSPFGVNPFVFDFGLNNGRFFNGRRNALFGGRNVLNRRIRR